MKIKLAYFVIFGIFALLLSGCCTTEERVNNFAESVHNIALDGDGVN